MAKSYKLRVVVDTSSVDAAVRKTVRGFESAGRAATAFARTAERAIAGSSGRWAQSVEKAAARARRAYASVRAPSGPAGVAGGMGGGGSTAGATRQGSAIDAIQDRLIRKDASRRSAYEGKKQRDAERSQKSIGDLQDKLLLRDAARRSRYEAKKQKDAEKTAQSLDAVQDRLARKDASRRARYEGKKQADAERESKSLEDMVDRRLMRDTERRNRYEAKKQKDSQRDAEKLDKIQDSLLQKDASRRNRYEAQKQREADRELKRQQKDLERLDKLQDQYTQKDYKRRAKAAERAQKEQAKANAAAAKAAVAFGVLAADQLRGIYKAIADESERAAGLVLEAKKNLRVGASVAGEGRVTNKALLKAAEFSAKTGLGDKDADLFNRSYEGTVNIATAKFARSGGKEGVSPEVAEQLKVEAAVRNARRGGDAGVSAELAGLLGAYKPIKTKEEGLAQLEQIRRALVTGRGDDEPLTQQLLNTAGGLIREGGPVSDLPGLSAVIAGTSLNGGPGAAGERATQLSRSLFAGLSRQRKVKGAKMTQGEYLKGIGVKTGMNLEQRLDLLVPDVKKAMASGKDLDEYLLSRGFGQEEERRAIAEVIPNLAEIKEQFAKARVPGTLGEDEVRLNREHLASPEGRAAVAEAKGRVEDFARGLPAMRLTALKKTAESSREVREGDQSVGTQVGDLIRGAFSPGSLGRIGSLDFNLSGPGRDARVQTAAIKDLERRARATGVDIPGALSAASGGQARGFDYGSSRSISRVTDPLFLEKYVNELEKRIEAKGGTNAVDIKPSIDNLSRVIENLDKSFQAADAGGAAPPVAGPQNRGNPRPLAPRPGPNAGAGRPP